MHKWNIRQSDHCQIRLVGKTMNSIHKRGNNFFELHGHTCLMALKDKATIASHAN